MAFMNPAPNPAPNPAARRCDHCGKPSQTLRLLPRNHDNPDSGQDVICANCYWVLTEIPERIEHPWRTLKPYPAP